MSGFHGVLGLIVFYLLAWGLSENRKHVSLKLILLGLFWQFVFALILLKVPVITEIFQWVNQGVIAVTAATQQAVGFMFGGLASPSAESHLGFILALQALPVLIVISALSALLFHWRILPLIIRVFSWVFQKTMRIGGTLGIAAAANVFIGMNESPLVIRPYLKRLTHSELFSLMVCGMAGVAGTVMVLYASIVGPIIPNVIGHVIMAVLISVPAALTVSRVMVPETEVVSVGGQAEFAKAASTLDAISVGIMDGAKVLVTVVAMLIGFLALIYLLNMALALLPYVDGQALSLQRVLGWLMSPVAWLMGVPWQEAQVAGSLLGTKMILNEVVAYGEFVHVSSLLSEKVQLMMLYALCGFANLGSVGIMIGIYGALIPERRQEVTRLGVRAVIAGTLSTCMTGTIVGMLYV
ncbi:Nucleoside permease NupX [Piscirickettsia salmonis]|uniref:Na+ dependent nucleoside transporter family protein n=1 Tax=Piscirickettsia salmonis TaxID=1238 RepID=A0A1L6TBV9_PISSA|nr:nucleoside transporter C-terminal domain-containing protein [Piscirickettsia salmonis]AKP73901.1 nucleoside:proton symporter [Piscirickettsia salmonis LF-89 = ATCC VR-1361]ALB22715.1 na+ dependent nucleoside transporter family protein [Piscirickettsia salmonis]ALY02719.1 nucleoside:proton symporter [Piscirickettsia salmonis]AMA42265.1 nucleoside:proton symporter [Piscirickettsia salmonis]AOS34740.1 nucleoside:proton symporter [Piscirickettsia salmonis]